MPEETERLEERVASLERAVTDGHEFDALAGAGEVGDRLAEIDDRLATLEERVDDLDAAVQAVRGYVGNVRAVNRAVERRADAALAAVEDGVDDASVEALLEERDDSGGGDGPDGRSGRRPGESVDAVVDRVRDAL